MRHDIYDTLQMFITYFLLLLFIITVDRKTPPPQITTKVPKIIIWHNKCDQHFDNFKP